MYNDLMNMIFVVSRLQSYDAILNVVSVAYGKYEKSKESEYATNECVMWNRPLHTMENNK